jgi:hypothetical protein
MVIPLGASEVSHLIDHRLEPVVHCLWLLSFVEDESTELSFDRLALGDFGHLDIPNFFGIFQPLHLIILLSTQGGEEYRSCLGIKMPYLGGLIGVIICWGEGEHASPRSRISTSMFHRSMVVLAGSTSLAAGVVQAKARAPLSLRRAKVKTIKDFKDRMTKVAKTTRLCIPQCKKGPVCNPAHVVGPRPQVAM